MIAQQTATYAATLRWVARSADRAAGDQLQNPLRGIAYLREHGCGLLELEMLQQLVVNAVDSMRELSAAAERLRARLVLDSMWLRSTRHDVNGAFTLDILIENPAAHPSLFRLPASTYRRDGAA